MQRSFSNVLLAATVAGVLVFAGAARADKPESDQKKGEKAQKHDDSQKHDQAQKHERDQKQRDQAQKQDQKQRDQAQQRQRNPFLSGFYLGYRAGYRDASDDSYWLVLDLNRREAGERRGEDRTAGREGREGLRQRLRDWARGQADRDERSRDMARSDMDRGRFGQRSREQRPDQQAARTRPHRLSGEVMRMKEVNLQGTDAKHLVVLLKTDQGKQRIVDLGLTNKLEKLDIEKGTKIDVLGRMIKVGDRIVLRADRVRANDQVASLRYVPREMERGQESGMARQPGMQR